MTERTKNHGMSKTRIFRIWSGMMSRCYNPHREKYPIYGGRGIKVCSRWHVFMNFYNDMLEGYSDSLSIERKDNDGDYYKENCKWATPTEQCRNRSTSRFIEYNNESKTLAEWAEITGIRNYTIIRRIKRGWSIEDTLTKPEQPKKRKLKV